MSGTSDPKQGEREYFARIGEEGRRHSLGKPFSDEHCGQYLVNIAALLALMRPPPARIVEFGCGTGWLGQMFAMRGYDVIGVDISPEAIVLADQLKADRGLTNVTYRVGDYEEVRIDPPVDYVIFHDALHHAESEVAALRAAYDALKPGGMVLCVEPGEGHSQSESSRRAVAEFGVHEKDMPPATIVRHARQAGFSRYAVLPLPASYLRTMYRTSYAAAGSQREIVGRRLLSFYRAVRLLWRLRRQGLVVLWKD